MQPVLLPLIRRKELQGQRGPIGKETSCARYPTKFQRKRRMLASHQRTWIPLCYHAFAKDVLGSNLLADVVLSD
jgi:hypothetical protein